MPKSLIGSVKTMPERARPGESVRVEVLDGEGNSYAGRDDTSISINGIEGATQYLQFSNAGERPIVVRATRGEIAEQWDAEVVVEAGTVTASGPGQNGKSVMLNSQQSLTNPYEVTFTLSDIPVPEASHPIPAPAGPSYEVADAYVRARKWKILVDPPKIRTLDSASRPSPKNYEWDFGDGTTAATVGRQVTHDFTHTIDAHHATLQFNVRCQSVSGDIDVTRTLVLHSAYVLCKKMGTIVPPVISDIHATKTNTSFSGTLHVTNLENTPIIITHRAVVPRSDDPNAAERPVFVDYWLSRFSDNVSSPVDIGENRVFEFDRRLTIEPEADAVIAVRQRPSDEFPPDIPGFTVYFAGHTADEAHTPVRFNAVFEIPVADRGTPMHESGAGGDGNVLTIDPDKIEERVPDPVFDFDPHVFDPLERRDSGVVDPFPPLDWFVDSASGITVVSSGPKNLIGRHTPLQMEARERVLASLRTEADLAPGPHALPRLGSREQGGDPNMPPPAIPFALEVAGPPEPGPIEEGEVCAPYQLTPEDEATAEEKNLACQLDGEPREVRMPGRFMNARKGDILLSPGGAGLIASLLRTVEPAQHYSHCGIMSGNYVEVTHSTASESRLHDYKMGWFGNDGIRSDVLKYMWPGAVTQSAEDSVNGELWPDPETGTEYTIRGFHPYSRGSSSGGAMEVVPPLVIKPDPMKETPEIREKLHGIANDARADAGRPGIHSKSHYRLYGYTDPTIAFDIDRVAPTDAGWAAGTYPSVCSSFIWQLFRRAGLNLESSADYVVNTDLEDKDREQGAEVAAGTVDGLYHYTAEERRTAAKWLFDAVWDQVYREGGPLGVAVYDAPDEIAKQICNTFTNDYAQSSVDWDNDSWEDAGDADAVSPDNIMWWDSPHQDSRYTFGYYGYAEPLMYRAARIEQYTVSRWKRVPTDEENVPKKSTVTGHVTRRGHGGVPGALVEIASRSTYTDSDGQYEISSVPYGDYAGRAKKTINGRGYVGKWPSVVINEETEHFNIVLQPPAEVYRRLTIQWEFKGVDDETWSADEVLEKRFFDQRDLSPFDPTTSLSKDYFWGGECYVTFDFDFSLLADGTVKVNLKTVLYESTAESHDPEDEVERKEKDWIIEAPNPEEDNPEPPSISDKVKVQEDNEDYVELTFTIVNDVNPVGGVS